MKDWLFYPLAGLVIAGLIYGALSFGGKPVPLTTDEVLRDGFVLEGPQLELLTASPGTTLTLGADTVTLKSHIAKNQAPASAGVFGTLSTEYETAYADKMLEISVRAKSEITSARFEVGYFTAGAGDSGWKEFDLTPNYQDHTFFFRPGPVGATPGADYIGIWPGKTGIQDPVQIERISVKVLASGG